MVNFRQAYGLEALGGCSAAKLSYILVLGAANLDLFWLKLESLLDLKVWHATMQQNNHVF